MVERKKKKKVEIDECEKERKTLSDLATRKKKGNLLHFPFANKMNIQIELSETCVVKSQKTC